MQNVRKLVVTEARYAKIYTYQNTSSYGWDFFKSRKTALISSNAAVTIAFDLKKMNFQLDAQRKKIVILNVPPPEISIDPNLTYYRIENGLINKFEAGDLNRIKGLVTKDLERILSNSAIVNNAQNRLFSELSQIYILAGSMGWSLEHDGTLIDSEATWQKALD